MYFRFFYAYLGTETFVSRIMKNLTTTHYSIKQSVLSDLLNSPDPQLDKSYINTKISLINNAIVFPVPMEFSIEDFNDRLTDYLNTELKAKTEVQVIGNDIYSLPFSTIVLIKKTVVYHLMDSHLYINIVPVKEIENANYKEGAISGLLSSGKSDKIYEFVENYLMDLYKTDGLETVNPYGRYFFTSSLGLGTILASHLEDGERILAKLDIYKIEQSKSNAQTSQIADGDEAFYLNTTHGSYLMVLDDNLQEKYVETLSDEEMKISTKLTRDLVTCGGTQWLCNRDNNKLFAEVAPFNNVPQADKLNSFAQLHFNNADSPDDKIHASHLLDIFAQADSSPFAYFSASLIGYSASLQSDADDTQASVTLMERANALLGENDFSAKLKAFLSEYKFSSQELIALIFVISRAKNRIADTAEFASVLADLRDRYFKSDSDSINRAFISLSIAKKLNMVGEKESAFSFASEAFDNVGYNYAVTLAPGFNTLPDDQFSGDSLTYSALDELFKSAVLDMDKLKYAMAMAECKPLIKSNFDNVRKYCIDDAVKARYNSAMMVFDAEGFNNFGYMPDSDISGKFGKLSESAYMPACTDWRKTFSGFKSWAQKSVPDKTFAMMRTHGTLVDTNNYHLLYTLGEQLSKYFDIEGVELYVFSGRNQGVVAIDDDTNKFIMIDSELLDTDNENYMNANELTFVLAREYASLKLGFSRLTCHQQWRNFATLGVRNIDVISTFAKDSDFISKESEQYNRILAFNKLISMPGYFNFDVEDVHQASQMLAETLATVEYKGTDIPADIKERELSALCLLTTQILDRIGILLSGNIVNAIKAIIHTDHQISGGIQFCNDHSVYSLACGKGDDDMPVNYDFAMRIDALLSFYLSSNYKKY